MKLGDNIPKQHQLTKKEKKELMYSFKIFYNILKSILLWFVFGIAIGIAILIALGVIK